MVPFPQLFSATRGLLVAFGIAWASALPAAAAWTILHEKDVSATEVRLQWVVRAGSLSDSLDKSGLSHFTARALLRGTSTRPYADLQQALRAISATITVEPGLEYTRLDCRFPANRLDSFLNLARDLFSNPEFEPMEMELLRRELISELQSARQDSRRLASETALERLYAGTPAQFPASGTAAGLSRITSRDLRAYFRAQYGVSNMVLAMVSPWDESLIRSKIQQGLQGLPDVPSNPRTLPDPVLKGMEGVIIADPSVTDVAFQFVVPGVASADVDRMGLEVANRAFGVGPDSRLAQSAPQLNNGWLTWASSGFSQILSASRGAGVFSIIGNAGAPFVADILPETVELFRQFIHGGMTDSEFRQARDAQLAAVPGLLDSASKRLEHRLDAMLSGSPALDLPAWQSELSRWDFGSASSRLKARLSLDPMVVVAIGDASQLGPLLSSIPGMGTVRTISR